MLYNYIVQILYGHEYDFLQRYQANLAKLWDKIIADRETFILKRRGKEDLAVLPADDVSSFQETLYLLSSPANATRLLESMEDHRYWVGTRRKTALRVLDLIEAIMRDPFQGIGKPEALKYLGPGIWLQRITKQDKIVYILEEKPIFFLHTRSRYRR